MGTYTPGDFLQYVRENITVTTSLDDFLNSVISHSKQHIEADFGEGYWVDHWTYNLDLIENYLKVFPEALVELLFDDTTYRFYKSPVFVKPSLKNMCYQMEKYDNMVRLKKKKKRLARG